MSAIPGEEAALRAFEALWQQYGNQGLWRWTKELRGFAVQWGWMPLLGGDDKRLFETRSLALMRAISSVEYAAHRRDQLAQAGFKYIVYRCRDKDGPNGCGEVHGELDGIVCRPDDEFLDRYRPPTRWDCRCDLAGARGEKMIPMVGGNLLLKPPPWAFEDDPVTGLPKHCDPVFKSIFGPSIFEIILNVATGEADLL